MENNWIVPNGGISVGLKVYNSLTKSKVEFIPTTGRQVRWYMCGPTVYDSAHIGHARNYITFDIIRRILTDYFNYNVFSVMNITDIDDKIIVKARKNYLYQQYVNNHSVFDNEVKNTVLKSIQYMTKKYDEYLKNITMNSNINSIAEANLYKEKLKLTKDMENIISKTIVGGNANDILAQIQDMLAQMLDDCGGYKLDSSLVKNEILKITKQYEEEFIMDMKNLNVQLPDVITRVSEYIPEIIEMIRTIIKNGYGYKTEDGCVYFDTIAFSKKHKYAKLEPNALDNSNKLSKSYVSLTTVTTAKRCPNDFALWKASKLGEPIWESEWGPGRPGWHIECSAMAGNLLGAHVDIHVGGEDLRFPHHDNEMAQSEAFFDSQQWVNYFLHSGHLHIDGLKMSKSLKNFITIRQVMSTETHPTPRQFRWLFLLQPWYSIMNYRRDDPFLQVKAMETKFQEFFLKVANVHIERAQAQAQAQAQQQERKEEAWTQKDKDLHTLLLNTQTMVHLALCDNFDTPKVMNILCELVTAGNVYISSEVTSRKSLLLSTIVKFITKILNIFGLNGLDAEEFTTHHDSVNENTRIRGFVDVIAQLRHNIRTSVWPLLQICDKVRDDEMPKLGVKMTDNDQFSYSFVDPEQLAREKCEAQRKKDEVQHKRTKIKKTREKAKLENQN
jgi:cysteinyl-tRNA synthetase